MKKLCHAPYSPDLSSTDYHFFLNLKKLLSRKIFTDSTAAQNVIANFVGSQTSLLLDFLTVILINKNSFGVRSVILQIMVKNLQCLLNKLIIWFQYQRLPLMRDAQRFQLQMACRSMQNIVTPTHYISL